MAPAAQLGKLVDSDSAEGFVPLLRNNQPHHLALLVLHLLQGKGETEPQEGLRCTHSPGFCEDAVCSHSTSSRTNPAEAGKKENPIQFKSQIAEMKSANAIENATALIRILCLNTYSPVRTQLWHCHILKNRRNLITIIHLSPFCKRQTFCLCGYVCAQYLC